MNKIINLAFRFSGFNWIWAKTDGYKAKGSAGIAMLTCLLGLLTGLAPLLAVHDAAGIYHFVMGLPANEYWLGLVASAYALGIAHKQEKALAAVTPAPAAELDKPIELTPPPPPKP